MNDWAFGKQGIRNVASLMIMLCALPVSASVDANWLDFTGWDHTTITTSGQTFSNISGDIDVTVTGSGVNEVVSIFDGTNVRTGADTGSMEFVFSFSQPLDLVVDVQSTDLLERIDVSTDGVLNYSHLLGAMPDVNGSLVIHGNGFGFDSATGSARGYFTVGQASQLTWSYSSVADNKFEWFRLGTQAVPEPQSLGWIGGLVLLANLRRRSLSRS